MQVDLEGNMEISGTGLASSYKAAQFHFHWGDNDNTGSENAVDGRFYPMEVMRQIIIFFINATSNILNFLYSSESTTDKKMARLDLLQSFIINCQPMKLLRQCL